MNLRMDRAGSSFLCALALTFSFPTHEAHAAKRASAADATSTVATIDRFLAETYPPGEPGAAVLVEKGGKVVLRKGYGLANVEHDIPVKPETVFALGSVTKQFTAAAILLLEERGKLSVEDELTKYLPDYPTHGKKVTLEHLLTHTSGIPSYTGMPEWLPRRREDLTVEQLLGLFKERPFEFEPGTKWAYDNSGYALLGAVIEKVSGTTYERFVEDEIFKPLGMSRSLYNSWSDIVPNRAAGYDPAGDGWANTDYLSMTSPYAAGALLSTLDDLARWDEALAGETLLKRASIERMFTPYRLASGLSTRYGYGWAVQELGGRKVLEHNGGINGFTCDVLRIPQEGIFVAVLTNRRGGDRSPAEVAGRIAKLLLGLPLERQEIGLDSKALDDYVGVYRNDDITRIVTRDGEKLYARREGGGPKAELAASGPDELFYRNSESVLRFRRDAQGKVTAAQMEAPAGPEEAPMARTSETPPVEAPPATRTAIQLDPTLLALYVGTYELAPNFDLVLTLEEGRLYAQPTGQKKAELFPESATSFFFKVVDAHVEFQKGADGVVTGLVLRQGGREMPGKRK